MKAKRSALAAGARLTEERLRNWLDGDQPSRERLCVHVLALDRRFSNVQPRQPKGGADSGFDLEATFQSDRRAVGAIGFRNSPSDNATDQQWVARKFKADLARARESAGAFDLFVFLTNVRVTVTSRRRLIEHAKSLGGANAEVFDRENLRVALDSPEGLAARYQFLQIALTDAEQASFFSRWGVDLEGLVTRSFAVVEDRLRRLEFMHERAERLTTLSFHLLLRDATPISRLSHVRALMSISRIPGRPHQQWHVGFCNNSPRRRIEMCGTGPCLAYAFWLDDPNKRVSGGVSSWSDPFSIVGAGGGFSDFANPRIAATLGDLDDSYFAFFMNRSLFAEVARIRIYANSYLLWSDTAANLEADPPNSDPTAPWAFSQEELADEWVRVMPKGFAGHLHFWRNTPRRLIDAKSVDEESGGAARS